MLGSPSGCHACRRGERAPARRLLPSASPLIRLQSVSREEAEGFAREIDAIYFETSAKTSLNVNRAFEAISHKLPTQQAPAFDSLADLRSPPIDPRLPRPGPRPGAGGGKPGGGCGCS